MYESVEKFYEGHAIKKAEYINKYNLDVFFEDAPDIVEKLRELCPKTIIIQVGGRLL